MSSVKNEGNRYLKKIKRRILEKYPNVDISVTELNSIRLTGKMNAWNDVVACGLLAVDKHFSGVVNDITLMGFTDTSIRTPMCNDKALDGLKTDVLVIGAGVVGCCIARELSKLNLTVMVAEKEYDVALGASSRNDGDVHVGIDLHKNQQKHYYNSRGNAMFDSLSEDLDIDFQRTGHIIWLYKNWERLFVYPLIKMKAKLLGIKGVTFLNGKKIRRYENTFPSWSIGAVYMPSGGEVSPYKLTVALAENAATNGVKFSFNTIVNDMDVKDGKILSVTTNRGVVYPKLVINAAGVFSDVIASMAMDRTFTIHPRKGTNLILDKKKGNLVRTSMNKTTFAKFPEEKASKGGHTKGGGVIHTVDNNILVGPNAIETPYREDVTVDMGSIKQIIAKQSKVSETMKMGDVITYFSGVRAPTYEEDFVVRKGIKTENIFEAAGIQSPGLTAAPAIAVDIAKWTKEYLSAEQKEGYQPKRKAPPHLNSLPLEKRNELIKSNPDYGEIVCRCEEISKGEILDALRSPLPVYTLDAIKRRVRPGMGRCQGGFCSPLVCKIISEEKGIPLNEVTKANSQSVILFGDTKGGNK